MQEEQQLIQQIYAEKKPAWVNLSQRRLKNLGGTPHHKGLLPVALPEYCQAVASLLTQIMPSGKMDWNQVLLNEYSGGKGIGKHGDGPLYKPMAAVLSLETPALIQFFESQASDKEMFSLMLQPQSLLLFKDAAYTNIVHGIETRTSDAVPETCCNLQQAQLQVGQEVPRGARRVSLTIRSCAVVAERSYSIDEEQELRRREQWWTSSINEKN